MTGKGYEKAVWGARKLLHHNMITYVLKKNSVVPLKFVCFTVCVLYLKRNVSLLTLGLYPVKLVRTARQ